ncbi:hypothetical protein B0O99DRAFT_730631, partial [Bisporella sp. PMI_857]
SISECERLSAGTACCLLATATKLTRYTVLWYYISPKAISSRTIPRTMDYDPIRDFTLHCSTCTICTDGGGNYRICATGRALLEYEQEPRLNPTTDVWERPPNTNQYLLLDVFNAHAGRCKVCGSELEATASKFNVEGLVEEKKGGDGGGDRDDERRKLCWRGNRMAGKVTSNYWMDEEGVVRGVGEGVRECVMTGEGEETGKLVRVREKDIVLCGGGDWKMVWRLLEKVRDEKGAGREFVKRKRTFREIFKLGRWGKEAGSSQEAAAGGRS